MMPNMVTNNKGLYIRINYRNMWIIQKLSNGDKVVSKKKEYMPYNYHGLKCQEATKRRVINVVK
jgi:hypothetical protein